MTRFPVHFALAIALLAGAAVPLAQAKQRDVATRPVTPQPDGAITAEQRLAAARVLLKSPDDRAARQRVAQAFARGPSDPEAIALLTAMQDGIATSDAPAWFGPLSLMANDPQRIRNPLVIGALSSFRTRDAARLLVRALPVVDDAVRPQVFAALTRLSGRDDLGDDTSAWARWLAEAERQSESQWRSALLDGIGARADRLDAARDSALARLAEGYARLHLATPPEQRSALLASMLADPLAAVCGQGMELVSRELAATNRLDASVGDAAVGVLARPEPELRASAALLVNQLVPAAGPEAVRRALGRETDPRVAAALLQTATRWPSREVGDAALAWMSVDSPARAAACDAAWAMLRAGGLDFSQQQRALESLRDLPPSDRPASACSMLAWLGTDEDRRSLVELLTGIDAAKRLASAEALAPYPEFEQAIIDASARDATLLNAAVRAVVLHDQTVRGFEAINRASAGGEGRRAALVAIAAVLPAEDLLAVGSAMGGDPLQEAVLAQFVSPVRLMSERVDPQRRDALAQGLVLLARRRIELDLPAEALSALDQLPSLGTLGEKVATATEVARLRIVALLMLGRIDAATETDDAPGANPATPDADAWLDGLERSLSKPHVAQIIAHVRAKLAPSLNDAQRARLNDLAARLAPKP